MRNLLERNKNDRREDLQKSINSLYEITSVIGHSELQATVDDIRQRVADPFMFVIVGEVKAGKSSFINALLEADKEICKVAPSPMTDTIQQIVYGEKESIVEINPYLKRIYQNVEILKEIAIVDTPGTNTIIDHHQEITENFIPSSDLIVFVFEAKNPYRQSAWSFFDFIKEEWRKKIIFILQQKDLMSAEDLLVNVNGVKEYARKKGIMDARVFPVSAKMELENDKNESGFIGVREYIHANITGGKAPLLKQINIAQTGLTINDKIYQGLSVRKNQFESDQAFREDIRLTLDKQESKTHRQVDNLVENLVAVYDRITNKSKEELNQGIGFFNVLKRSLSSTFGGGQSLKDWLAQFSNSLEQKLNKSFKERLQEGVVDIADSIQDMGRMIDVKLKNSETILKDNHEIFADIAERRSNVLKELQEAFSGFLRYSENFYDEDLFAGKESIAPNLATGGGIAIVGVILAALPNTLVVDITGGILTGIGVLFAGVTLGLNRRKLLNGFSKAIDEGRDHIQVEVSRKLNNYTSKIKERIDDNFYKFDALLEEESKVILNLESSYQEIRSNLDAIKLDLEKEL